MAELRRAARRWYQPTPDGCVLGLLAVEGLLWLFERAHGFGSPPPKGWVFVITAAIVAAVLFLMLAWFVVSLFVGWRFQFSIRSLLVLVVVVAIPCSWFAVEAKKARRQQEAVEEIKKVGGSVIYDWQPKSRGEYFSAEPPVPVLVNLLGVDFFADVSHVYASDTRFTDAALKNLKDLTKLRELHLSKTKITDAGLEELRAQGHLTRLRQLGLAGTDVTDAGLEHLKGSPQLNLLEIDDSQLTDVGVKHLRALTNLDILCLKDGATGAGLERLKDLTQLRCLVLDHSQVTDAALKNLEGATQLHELYLRGTRITDAGLGYLKGLKELEFLDPSDTQVTSAGVEEFHHALPKCGIQR